LATLIIGDFTAAQMHKQHRRNDELYHEFSYLTDDSGELSWLTTNAKNTISSLSTNINNVVIMIGFNDCVYSCIWDSAYKLTDITEKYINAINDLKAQYPNLKFYVCSVIPVDSDYPHSECSGGAISKSKLNEKIDSFNTEINTAITDGKCNVAGFIDCNKYLKEMNFSTFDGKRYTRDAIVALKNYIGCYVDVFTSFGNLTSLDGPRFDLNEYLVSGKLVPIPPKEAEQDIYNYYASNKQTAHEGTGSCPAGKLGKNPHNPHDKESWFVLPNCNAYAWGRFAEIYAGLTGDSELEKNPITGEGKFSFINNSQVLPGKWVDIAKGEGYTVSFEPEVGAAACWHKNDLGEGHIAIVEYVSEDRNTIITSESAWSNNYSSWIGYDPNNNSKWGHFFVAERHRGTNGQWNDLAPNHRFDGFIYQPTNNRIVVNKSEETTDDTPQQVVLDTVAKSDVTCSNVDLRSYPEKMTKNALYIWQYLCGKGWSPSAVAGVLGNMEVESGMNPGRGEDGGSGFGLVQWTPANDTLIPWCNKNGLDYTDINAQLDRIIYEKDTNIEYKKGVVGREFGIKTFDEFATSDKDPYTLGCAWAFDYERSGVAIWGFHRNIKNANVLPPHSGTNSDGSKWRRTYCAKKDYDSNCETTCEAYESCYKNRFGETRCNQRKEENRDVLCDERGGAAERWYERFSGKSFTAKKDFLATNLILTKQTPTTINAAFITLFGTSGSCRLINNKNALEINPTIMMSDPIDNISIGTFKCANLVPNTEYTMLVSVKNDSSGEEVLLSQVFTTEQSRPVPVKTAELITTDNKMPYNSFQLKTSKISDWGYWKVHGKKDTELKQSYGYTIKLIVNGTVKKEKKLKSLNKPLDFNITEYFEYIPKIGDNIQIGIRTWTVDNNGTIVYDSQVVTTSNPICMLTKPIVTYLNTN